MILFPTIGNMSLTEQRAAALQLSLAEFEYVQNLLLFTSQSELPKAFIQFVQESGQPHILGSLDAHEELLAQWVISNRAKPSGF